MRAVGLISLTSLLGVHGTGSIKAESRALSAPVWTLEPDGATQAQLFGEVRDVLRLRDGRTAILDVQLGVVRLYAPDGTHLEDVTCKGEGPGEVVNFGPLVEFPARRLSVVQVRPPKLAMLPIDEHSADDWLPTVPSTAEGGWIQGAATGGGRLVLRLSVSHFAESGSEDVSTIYYWASELVDGQLLMERSSKTAAKGATLLEYAPTDELQVWTVDSRGQLLIAPRIDEFAVEVHGPSGLIRKDAIEQYPRYKRTPDRLAAIKARFERMLTFIPSAQSVSVSEYDRDVQSIYPKLDGGYLILSSQGKFGTHGQELMLESFSNAGDQLGSLRTGVIIDHECDQFWISEGHLYVYRGGVSVQRASRRSSAAGALVLGESDPCAERASIDGVIECFKLE